MTRPLAVVVGFVGKLPMAGMTLYNTHYIAGLQQLGYDVHYVEQRHTADEYYDPATNAVSPDVSAALVHLKSTMLGLGIQADGWSLIDLDQTCHGSGWSQLKAALGRADFVLNLCDATWFDELGLCAQRAFLDGDPLFTQAAMLENRKFADRVAMYDVLITYCTRMGRDDCAVPDAGRKWIASRPVVATVDWNAGIPANAPAFPVTNLLNWSPGAPVVLDGIVYGQKGSEVERFSSLPSLAPGPFALAIGGSEAPRDQLKAKGWNILDPLMVTSSESSYRKFISGSRADFGIAKHAYVASRSGWFSDRSTCYLASGRPVLHQDTGFAEWLPSGRGVFSFATLDDARQSLEEIDSDYIVHARAARAIAEEYFEARKVIGQMLDDASFR